MKYQTAIEQGFKPGDKVIVHYNVVPFKQTKGHKNYSFDIGKITEENPSYLCFIVLETNEKKSKLWTRIKKLEKISQDQID